MENVHIVIVQNEWNEVFVLGLFQADTNNGELCREEIYDILSNSYLIDMVDDDTLKQYAMDLYLEDFITDDSRNEIWIEWNNYCSNF